MAKSAFVLKLLKEGRPQSSSDLFPNGHQVERLADMVNIL
jgi:hypothetical protein